MEGLMQAERNDGYWTSPPRRALVGDPGSPRHPSIPAGEGDGRTPVRVNGIVHCRRPVTADTALRLGRVLNMTPEFWMNLQQRYDLEVARAGTDVSGMERLVEAEPVGAGG